MQAWPLVSHLQFFLDDLQAQELVQPLHVQAPGAHVHVPLVEEQLQAIMKCVDVW